MNNFDNNRFRAIVKALRQMVRCPHCSGTFSEKDIEMVSNFGPAYAVKLSCSRCGLKVIASLTQIEQSVAANSHDHPIVQNGDSVSRGNREKINDDDMINLHQFLDNFDGDFRAMFD
ncbi:MAG: hypothetical protein WC570_05170 [Patescibacteria group bacterium]